MFKIFLSTAVSLLSVSSFALDTLTCGFTEPFITVQYNANTKVVTETNAINVNEVTGELIETVLSQEAAIYPVSPDTSAGHYLLVDVATNKVLMTFALTGDGGDGMSDQLYPFSAVYQSNRGGCSTETAPVIDPLEVMDKLGSSYYLEN